MHSQTFFYRRKQYVKAIAFLIVLLKKCSDWCDHYRHRSFVTVEAKANIVVLLLIPKMTLYTLCFTY